MHLYAVPLYFVLAGLTLYAVLGGADFGAGAWQLLAGRSPEGRRISDHAHHSMGPVWEANHVWLLFVLTVSWTAYPEAFASIASTLCVPLLIAGIGIIMRGAAYALRSGARNAREVRRIDTLFGVSSILTPFALGTVVGAIASGRVPVGNAAGDLITSWTGPVSIMVGALAVATSAYLAAVYLAADAARIGDRDLERAFRTRALGSGVVGGALAVAGLVVLHADAHSLYSGLVSGGGLVALIASGLGGVAALALVRARRYELARYSASLAVAAIVVGWALAQEPVLLPGLTVQQAAAPHDTLVAVVIAVLGGAVILFPSLAILFRLVLRGGFEREPGAGDVPAAPSAVVTVSRPGLLARSSAAALIAGIGFLNVADAGWAHAIGVLALVAFIVLGFAALVPPVLGQTEEADT
jgi:cytochrome bd ubiquinol oxidase subunit II